MTDFMDNPWKLAEDTVFKKLCEVTGSQPNKNAFIGYLPPVGNSWALKVGGGGNPRNTWGSTVTELWMDADIEGLFIDRAKAQQFALSILDALPVQRIDNVQSFRIRANGMPDIKIKELTFANEDTVRLVWAVSIGCEIVFNTVTRANVEPET